MYSLDSSEMEISETKLRNILRLVIHTAKLFFQKGLTNLNFHQLGESKLCPLYLCKNRVFLIFGNFIPEKQYLIAVFLGISWSEVRSNIFNMFICHLYFLLWELPTVSHVYFSLDDFISFLFFFLALLWWNNIFSTKDIKSAFDILVVNMFPCCIIFRVVFFFAAIYWHAKVLDSQICQSLGSFFFLF